MTHICVGKLTMIGSDNGLSPGRRQAIIWTNAGILLIGPLGTNFSEILFGIQTSLFKKMHLKMSSAKWRPICLGLNVLRHHHHGILYRDSCHTVKRLLLEFSLWDERIRTCTAQHFPDPNDHLHHSYTCTWWRKQMETFSALLAFCGEFTGHWWIPLTKASGAELWMFLWSAQMIE